MNIKKLLIILSGIFWPLSLYLTNNFSDYVKYILPTLLLTSSYLLFKKNYTFFLFPLLVIPTVDIKLNIFPLLVFAGYTMLKPRYSHGVRILFLMLSLFLLILNGRAFQQNSVFKLEYEAKQKVLRDIHLYPNTFLARAFQNKVRIVIDKISNNFFALIDPGNYFFSFHPREGTITNQNLVKFPFLAMVPVFIGLLEISKLKERKYTALIFFSAILSLSFVEIFDRSDFIIWLPLTLIFIHGINIIYKLKNRLFYYLFSVLFIANCVIELIRTIVIYRS